MSFLPPPTEHDVRPRRRGAGTPLPPPAVVRRTVLALELRLLARHGVLAAVVVVTLVWAGLLLALPDEVTRQVVAVALYLDAAIVGLLFVGGGVLVERRQGSLEALAVSAIRPEHYVLAKVVSMTGLAVLATSAIALVAAPGLRPIELLLGVLLLSIPVMLLALGIAARTTTITGYLFALQPATLPAVLPLAMAAGWVPDWVGWLGPTTGPYRLLEAGTGGTPLAAGAWWLAVGVPLGASMLAWRFAVGRVRRELLRSGRLT